MLNKTKLYTIEWRVNGILKETLNMNNPRPIAVTYSWMKELKNTTHKTGVLTLKIVENN